MQKIGTGIYLKKENKIKTIWKRIQQKQNQNMAEKKDKKERIHQSTLDRIQEKLIH